jgi:hypothetical protein
MVKNEHNKNGTIYICYQGVGKSSTVNECDFFIDLESSNLKMKMDTEQTIGMFIM